MIVSKHLRISFRKDVPLDPQLDLFTFYENSKLLFFMTQTWFCSLNLVFDLIGQGFSSLHVLRQVLHKADVHLLLEALGDEVLVRQAADVDGVDVDVLCCVMIAQGVRGR